MKKLVLLLLVMFCVSFGTQAKKLYIQDEVNGGSSSIIWGAWMFTPGADGEWYIFDYVGPSTINSSYSIYVLDYDDCEVSQLVLARLSDASGAGTTNWNDGHVQYQVAGDDIDLAGSAWLNNGERNLIYIWGSSTDLHYSIGGNVLYTPTTPLGDIKIRLYAPICDESLYEYPQGSANYWNPEYMDGNNPIYQQANINYPADAPDVRFYYWYYTGSNGTGKMDGVITLSTGLVAQEGENESWYEYTFSGVVGALNLIFLRKANSDGVGFPNDANPWWGDETRDITGITESTDFRIDCLPDLGNPNYANGAQDHLRNACEMTPEESQVVFVEKPTGISQTGTAGYTVIGGSAVIFATFEGAATVELFSVSGSLLTKTTATGSFWQTGLAPGLYIVKINGQASKVAVK
ncbi:MAG: T9SS type A sorting domain-containing protein [Candidatus Azobacteroides sp.]|nr:T9SS type A sorting domain-containing protein [Candidatus Azobacteroides sp.]